MAHTQNEFPRLRGRERRDGGSLPPPGTVHRARFEAILLTFVLVTVIVLFDHRMGVFGPDLPEVPLRASTAAVVFGLGWALIRNVWGVTGSALMRRTDPRTAVNIAFLIKLATAIAALLVELHIAGVSLTGVAIGGALTAIIFGLAAQQLLGNVLAGAVLLSARPFSIGERVRLQGGPIGGQIEGVVTSLGLLYVTIAQGDDSVLIPNSVVQQVALMPLYKADSVKLRARLPSGVTPQDLQAVFAESLSTPLRGEPRLILEGVDGDDMIVDIEATPTVNALGGQLATELLEAITRDSRCSVESIDNDESDDLST
jgi:small conductance mechanosensitive channel